MSTNTELERLAAMANALRPEWPVASLLTHLKTHHAARPYRDLAVALAWIAADPDTQNPGRLGEAGPWWGAANPKPQGPSTPVPPPVCRQCRHPHKPDEPHDVSPHDLLAHERKAGPAAARAALRTAAATPTTEGPEAS